MTTVPRQYAGPTRWLNTLVVVTLVTVTVAIAYLGYYYVGAGSDREVTWFAPGLVCRPLETQCGTALGRFGDMQTRWQHEGGQLTVEVTISGLPTRRVRADIERLAAVGHEARIWLERVGPGHYRGRIRLAHCISSAGGLRGELVAATDKGLLGSWYDFDFDCRAGVAATGNRRKARARSAGGAA